MMKKGIILDWLQTVNWMAFILSFAIAVPLLVRPFYYAHIEPMHLEEYSGFSKEEIRESYDEMMDFCVFGKPFGTGKLKYSEDGKSHFEDVAKLFRLDFIVLAVSSALLVLFKVLENRGIRADYKLHTPRYKGAVGLLAGGVLLASACAIDFDKAFVTFHHIFFPGKTNWIFDYRTDEIIMILPEEFFRNCAILIVAVMLGLCAFFIITENRKLRNRV